MKQLILTIAVFIVFAAVGWWLSEWVLVDEKPDAVVVSGPPLARPLQQSAVEEGPPGDREKSEWVFNYETSEEFREAYLKLRQESLPRFAGHPEVVEYEHQFLMQAWAEKFPFDALEFVYDNRSIYYDCELIVMEAAVKADHARALEFVIANARSTNSIQSIKVFSSILAKENPEAALALVDEIPPGSLFSALNSAFKQALADTDPKTQEAYLECVRPELRGMVRDVIDQRVADEIASRLDGEVRNVEVVARSVMADIAAFAETADAEKAERLFRSEAAKLARLLPPEKVLGLLGESGLEVDKYLVRQVFRDAPKEYLDESFTFIEQNPEYFEDSKLREVLVKRLAEEDRYVFVKEFERLFSSPDNLYTTEDFKSGFATVVYRDGRDAANLWANLENETLRNAAAEVFVDSLTINKDFDNAREWVATITDNGKREELTREIVDKQLDYLTRSVMKEYEQAREMALAIEEPGLRAETLDELARREAYQYSNDDDFERAREVAATIVNEKRRLSMFENIALEEARHHETE